MKQILESKTYRAYQENIIKKAIIINEQQLYQKEHIREYAKLKNIYNQVVNKLMDFIYDETYPIKEYHEAIAKDIIAETNGLVYNFNYDNEDDKSIIEELFVYKTHSQIKPLIELATEKKKFRNKEKLSMIEAMNNSYVSLFKVKKANNKTGYVELVDVFSKKKFKIIDIALSSCTVADKKHPFYIYSRIITIDGISFGTGIHCFMSWRNKKLKKFIETHKYNNCSDFSRCLLVYALSKEEENLIVTYNREYGTKR